MSRKNQAKGVAKTGKKMVVKSIFAVGGSFAAAKAVTYFINQFGDTLPAWARKATPIAVPVIGGATLAYYGKDNKMLQDAATGMVIAGVSSGFNEGLKLVSADGQTTAGSGGNGNGEDLSDYYRRDLLGDNGPVMVTEDGRLVTPSGRELPAAQVAGTKRFGNQLGDGAYASGDGGEAALMSQGQLNDSWEDGETWG